MTEEEIKNSVVILKDYKEKCNILKQIHSNNKAFYDTATTCINVITIVSSLLLTIVGFINKDLLYDLFMDGTDKVKSLKFFDFTFNSVVVVVLLISILNLIFRFQDKAFEHNRAIILFSNIIRDISEVTVSISSFDQAKLDDRISQINFRYSTVIESIPSHSDKEFFKAKEDYYKKKEKSKEIDDKYKNPS